MSVLNGVEFINLESVGRQTVTNKDGYPVSLRASCNHADRDYELRRHVIANGTTQYKFECQVCGRRGSAISKNDPIRTRLDAEPPFTDPGLQERYWSGIEDAKQKQRDQWWFEYNQYLESPKWQAKRDLVLARDWHQCQAKLDGCTNTAEHVHHLSYEHLFNEPLFELVAVCRSCHDQIHGRMLTIMGVAV